MNVAEHIESLTNLQERKSDEPLLDSALGDDYVILSSVGKHAQQGWQTIIDRKRRDITKGGHTVWVTNSQAAAPQIVQKFCDQYGARYVIFVARHREKHGAQTSTNDSARSFSSDNSSWFPLDSRLSPVTGRITRVTTGLWFDALSQVTSGTLELDQYIKIQDGLTLTEFSIKDSAYPVRRANPDKATLEYEILAVGRLADPFAV